MSFIKEGFQFNGWTVLGPGKMTDSFKCQCQCGNEQELLYANILKGVRQNCGCIPTTMQRAHPFYIQFLLILETIDSHNHKICVKIDKPFELAEEISYYNTLPEMRSFYKFYQAFAATYQPNHRLILTDKTSPDLGAHNLKWQAMG